MRKNSDGRNTLQAGRYTPGERVYGAIDDCPGTVISVDGDIFIAEWRGAKFSVKYPVDTAMVRKAWPWES